MELQIVKFVLMYLLLPLIGVIFGVITFLIGKKNGLLNNKKLIYFFVASCVILALPALLGYIDYWFMPYAYICLQILYLILGYFFLSVLKKVGKEIESKPYYVEFLSVFVVMFVGIGLFSLIFNLCNELQYGLWACTCMFTFILPTLFLKTYYSFLEIPLEVYKVWSYRSQDDNLWIDNESENNKIIVVELELARETSDARPFNIKAKASENMPFGFWFKVFINDYNIKSSATPIAYSDYQDSYGWIFYRLSSFLGRKKYIDADLTFSENKVKEHQVIIAKRTRYENYSQVND